MEPWLTWLGKISRLEHFTFLYNVPAPAQCTSQNLHLIYFQWPNYNTTVIDVYWVPLLYFCFISNDGEAQDDFYLQSVQAQTVWQAAHFLSIEIHHKIYIIDSKKILAQMLTHQDIIMFEVTFLMAKWSPKCD